MWYKRFTFTVVVIVVFLYYLYVTLVQHEGEINKKNTNMKNKTSGEKQDLCESVCVPVECIVKTNIEINCT